MLHMNPSLLLPSRISNNIYILFSAESFRTKSKFLQRKMFSQPSTEGGYDIAVKNLEQTLY